MTITKELTAIGAMVCLAVVMASGGCGAKPWAATTRVSLPDEPDPPTLLLAEDGRLATTLSPSEQATALRAMRAAAGDGPTFPVDPPTSVPLRWSDIPNALYYACQDVEMAVVRTQALPGKAPTEYRFELETVEGWPGELIARRASDPEVYEATATIGRFSAEPDKAARAAALLESLRDWMARFGQKRQFPEEAR